MNSVAASPTAASGSLVGRPARPAILDGRGLRPQRPGSRAGEGRAPSIGAREGVPGDWSSKTGESRVAGCLDAIGELISRVSEEDLSGLSGDELLADAEALAKLISRLGAIRGRMLLAIDKKRSWRSSGTRTLTQWNEKASGQSPAAASREIKRAQALESDLWKLSAALTDGEIFPEHVDAVRRVFSTPALKEKLTEDGVQDELISHAQKCAPREFERRIKARAFAHDAASGVEAEKKDASRESLAFTREGSGMRVTGWFSDEAAAVVDTALSAIMGRKSADDVRTLPERRACAFVELATAQLDAGAFSTGARIRPHISVHVPLSTLVGVEKSLSGAAGSLYGAAKAQAAPPVHGCSILASDAGKEGGNCGGESRHGGNGERGPCTETGRGQGRLGQCLASLDSQAKQLGSLLGAIPASLDDKALNGLEAAKLDDGSALSMSQLARLLCDSSIARVVLSATGEVLDVGREKRLFTPAQTRAVVARDRTCRYPGCSDTLAHGQIHHALPWQSGGKTNLANAILLCWHHHALVHRDMISIRHHDGGFIFTRADGSVIGIRRHEGAREGGV